MNKKLVIITTFIFFLTTSFYGQVAIEGYTDDIEWFTNQIKKISNTSSDFSKSWKEIESYNAKNHPRFTIKILPKTSLYLFGGWYQYSVYPHPKIQGEMFNPTPFLKYSAWKKNKKVIPDLRLKLSALVIDRGDIEVLPKFEKVNNKWVISGDAPSWSITQESVLAHEIIENFHGLSNDFCKYSCDCPDGKKDTHDLAKQMENKVRKAFGQKHFRPLGCGDKEKPIISFGTHKIQLIEEKFDLKKLIYLK